MTTVVDYEILILDTGERYRCRPDENLLRAMERLNRRGIPVGCRGGGCGVCKVRVGRGEVRAARMSRAHVSLEEEAAGIGLACRLFPLSDLELNVIGGMRRRILEPRVASHSPLT